MNNTQLAIIIMMFIVTAVGSFLTGKQAGRRELAMQLSQVLAKGIGEVTEAVKRFAESLEEKDENN